MCVFYCSLSSTGYSFDPTVVIVHCCTELVSRVQCQPTVDKPALHVFHCWGEPERAPHLREVRHRCLYVYIYVPYVMPYSSIYSFTMAAASEPL